MSPEAIVSIVALQVIGFVTTLTAVRVGHANVERRVDKIEDKQEGLAHEYVPRTEVELGLNSLRSLVEKTYDLVRAYLAGGGRAIHAAAEPFPPVGASGPGLDALIVWAEGAFKAAEGYQADRVEIAKVLAACYQARALQTLSAGTS